MSSFRSRSSSFFSLMVLSWLFTAGAAAEQVVPRRPIAGSPGSADRALPVRDGCATFSWALVGDGASEIAVFAIEDDLESRDRVALRITTEPALVSWTPSEEQCLPPGRYAWVVRARSASGWSEWSEPRLFEVRGLAPGGSLADEEPRGREAFGQGRRMTEPSAQPAPASSGRVVARAEDGVSSLAGGSSFSPPSCIAGREVFSDVPASHPFCAWIQELHHAGVSAGCGTGPLRYCPDNPVTRGQLAVFLAKVLQARNPRQLDAGGEHNCAVLGSDRAACWGNNVEGQAPASPSADSFQSVSAGWLHTCSVRGDGKVVCWGRNAEGQAPAGPSADSFQSVSAGLLHTCGVRLDGKVVCWGGNAEGQAPAGPSADSFQSVSAGSLHTCGVRLDGKVVCWGRNALGQAPAGPSADSFQSVSAGDLHTCGVREDEKVVCWGDNSWDQAPVGPSADSYQSVSAGSYHTCGVRGDGKVMCWGWNGDGQAPAGPSADSYQSISADAYHTCGIRGTGTVVCWGRNNSGQATPPGWM